MAHVLCRGFWARKRHTLKAGHTHTHTHTNTQTLSVWHLWFNGDMKPYRVNSCLSRWDQCPLLSPAETQTTAAPSSRYSDMQTCCRTLINLLIKRLVWWFSGAAGADSICFPLVMMWSPARSGATAPRPAPTRCPPVALGHAPKLAGGSFTLSSGCRTRTSFTCS